MDIKELILLMWRKVGFLILGITLGAVLGLVVAEIETPIYEASTKVLVSRTRQKNSADMLPLSDEQLLAINLQLAKSQPVLNDVSLQLGTKVDVDQIQAATIPNTLILQLKVQDPDPKRAAEIANLLVQTLIQQNETLLSNRYEVFENAIDIQIDQVQKQLDSLQTQISQVNDKGIQEQLTRVNQQIEQLRTQIAGLEGDIASFPLVPTPLQRASLAAKQAQLDQSISLMNLYQQIQTNLTYTGKPGQGGSSMENPELATLQSTLDLYNQMQISLISDRESVHLARMQNKQNVAQIVAAIPPKNPVRPLPVLYILVGIIVGLSLAVTTILVIDHLDDSLKSAGQVEEQLGIPVLGTIPEIKGLKNRLVTLDTPLTPEAEAFRVVSASLEISEMNKSIRTLMLVNAGSAEESSSVAANLAIVSAQQGKRVILIDGDVRHPHLHKFFDMENQKGLADIMYNRMDFKSALYAIGDVEGMSLIPGGLVRDDLTGWLDAKKWKQMLLELQKLVDLVIVDSPSADVADAQVLASQMNAVVLVIRLGQTRIESAQATLKRFQRIGARVMGAVVNREPHHPNIKMQIFSQILAKRHKSKNSYTVHGEVDKAPISPP